MAGGAGRDSHCCHHSHRQKLSTCSHFSRSNHNYPTLPACSGENCCNKACVQGSA